MELVYLWVKDYKNIQKQGFNFSPRFTCSYDESTNKLTIDEKKDFVSIFPDNINITAIVGENGSGKSSLLELLTYISNTGYENCIIVYATNQTIYAQPYNMPSIDYEPFKGNDKYISFAENPVIPIQSYKLSWINYESKGNMHLDKIVSEKNKFHSLDNKYFVSKQAHVFYEFSDILYGLKDKYQFDTFLIYIKYQKIDRIKVQDNLEKDMLKLNDRIIAKIYPKDTSPSDRHKYYDEFYTFPTVQQQLAYNCFISFIQYFIEIKNSSIDEESLKKIINIFKEYIVQIEEKISSFNDYNIVYDVIEEFQKRSEELSKDDKFQNFSKIVDNILFLKLNLNKFVMSKGAYAIRIDLKKNNEIKECIEKTEYISAKLAGNELYFNLVDYHFINSDTNVKNDELSDGEKQRLKIIVDFLYNIKIDKDKNILVLADEMDNSLHPKWKKEIVKIFIDIFTQFSKKYDKTKIHFIFTTHSPFLLSDLPKENVIFLKKDKKTGNCINATKETVINPFGANIHTLLSHGFFMEDGLMGEFAKGKINEIKNFYEKVKKYEDNEKVKKAYLCFYEKKKKEFWQIQNIIGEPFLKTVIGNYLDEIEKIIYEDKAKEYEMQRVVNKIGKKDLQKYLESLKYD